MAEFIPGKTVRSTEPTVRVDTLLDPGSYRFQLVVLDNARNVSAPAQLIVSVRTPPITPIRPTTPITPTTLVTPVTPVRPTTVVTPITPITPTTRITPVPPKGGPGPKRRPPGPPRPPRRPKS
jgi:hypothetical protein